MLIAYFDCSSGASGDMVLGALLDAGLSVDTLRTELGKLHIKGWKIGLQEVQKAGIRATQAIVKIENDNERHTTHIEDIRATITESDLTEEIKVKSLRIFERLAEAEAVVHGDKTGHAHLHEVGALDSLIDVVGAVIGFSKLGIEKACCSRLNVGAGSVRCAHGVLPVPVPATLELIKGKPIYSSGIDAELLTPTGAAILTSFCDHFGPMPNMVIQSMGYGAGSRDLETPNVLRMILGTDQALSLDYPPRTVGVIESNIDDMNPQFYDNLITLTIEKGGLDVSLQPILMKKNRPGLRIQIICPVEKIDELAELVLTETTAIGLRWRIENRIITERVIKSIDTKFGKIRIKIAYFKDRIVNVKPEYDDCKRVARMNTVPLKDVMAEVLSRTQKVF